MKIKNRLHHAFTLVILTALIFSGLTILLITRDSLTKKLDKELSQTSFLVYKIVKNVFDLNKKILLTNLRLLGHYVNTVEIDSGKTINSDAEHYLTKLTDYVEIPTMLVNGKRVFETTELVDDVAELSGGNVSILQLFPQGLLQVATSLKRADGSRATQIYYPNDNDITQSVRNGMTYIDKAFEYDQWYIVAYKPVYSGGTVVGAIHVGIKPDIDDMRKHILEIGIGKTGHPFIVDTEGILVIDAKAENENVYHLPHIKKMINDRREGTVTYRETGDPARAGEEVIIHYRYLPEMEWIVASGSYTGEFFADLDIITEVIVLSLIIAFMVAVFVSFKLAGNLAKPINMLTESMNSIKKMQYDFSDFRSIELIKERLRTIDAKDDEVRAMAETFDRMLGELEDAQKQLVSKHRRYLEAEISKKIQAMLLPDAEKIHGQDESGSTAQAEKSGGNYFDSSQGPGNQTWYAIGDVLEHGIASGMIMMMAQSSINSMIKAIPDASQDEIVGMINLFLVDRIRNRLKADYLASVSILVTAPDGTCRYSGRHENISVFRKDRDACETFRTETYRDKDGRDWRRARLALLSGDILFIENGGFTNAKSQAGEAFGSDRLLIAIRENREKSPDEIFRRISAEVASHTGKPSDNASVFILRKD